MNQNTTQTIRRTALASALCLLMSTTALARVEGIQGPNFALAAKVDHITTADGGSLLIWGYSSSTTSRAQYPGPTLLVDQGEAVNITLTNNLPVAVSMVFPGQENVTAQQVTAPTVDGLLAKEALPGGTVRYTFTATHAGTYLYYSGTDTALQVEMGLVGVLIVRPGASYPNHAYANPNTRYDQEYLFLLSEMDPRIHQVVEFQGAGALAATGYLADYMPNYFLLNGRTAMDTVEAPYAGYLPTQPYNSLPQMHPGERVLMRVATVGRTSHPFHHHGNHARVIARQGRLLDTGAGTLDLSYEGFTINSIPGDTVDAIFEWTGKDLGWDVYGTATEHGCNGRSVTATNGGTNTEAVFDAATKEWCGDHGKPFPVLLPETQFLTIGPFYSGSPFMGALGALPPGEGGMNGAGGFPFMWHSHNERELTNYNIFPGGMMTMLIIQPPGTPIP